MSENSIFQSEHDTPWEDLGSGVSRQICGHDDRIMLVKVKFEAGARGELHEHYHSQVSYVASGVFEMSIGNERQTVQAGDTFYVKPDTIHGVKCLEPGVLVDVFSPAREDFL